jgi:hypothetical protein
MEMEMTTTASEQRRLAEVLTEIKEELFSFVDTHIQMLHSEWIETRNTLKQTIPLAAIAGSLLGTACLLFTAAAVALVAQAFYGNPYAWFFALVIIGALWMAGGAIMAYFARNAFRNRGLFPRKTLAMLKADRIWIENGARNQA